MRILSNGSTNKREVRDTGPLTWKQACSRLMPTVYDPKPEFIYKPVYTNRAMVLTNGARVTYKQVARVRAIPITPKR